MTWVSCLKSRDCVVAHLGDQLIGVPPGITIWAWVNDLLGFVNDVSVLVAVHKPTRHRTNELGDVNEAPTTFLLEYGTILWDPVARGSPSAWCNLQMSQTEARTNQTS